MKARYFCFLILRSKRSDKFIARILRIKIETLKRMKKGLVPVSNRAAEILREKYGVRRKPRCDKGTKRGPNKRTTGKHTEGGHD